jgi:hypothetical protein
MKDVHYSDNQIPNYKSYDYYNEKNGYITNSFGYRCPEWMPLPEGKKNVVILGCSHTFGEGLDENDVWVNQLYEKVDQKRLRFWNLGQPGASADFVVRLLYATEKVLFPKIIIVCWPVCNRRERLLNFDKKPLHQINLTSGDPLLKYENNDTDQQNFLKNVFFVEKFAEKTDAKVLHCFAQDVYNIPYSNNVFTKTSIKLCWPEWSTMTFEHEKRIRTTEPSLAKDGVHYGVEHHKLFAELFYNYFKLKLK